MNFDSPFTKKKFNILLSLTPNMGHTTIRRVIDRITVKGLTPEQFLVLPLERKMKEFSLKRQAAEALTLGLENLMRETELLYAKMVERNIELLDYSSACYPSGIEEFMNKPPALLYAYGNLNLLEQKKFCILISRNPTKQGLSNAEKAVEQQLFNHSILVSGHNIEGYRRASVTALRWGAPRIIVLDCGLFQALDETLDKEPFTIARLYRYQFDPSMDLVISASRPTNSHIGDNYRLRDEMIAAMSDILIAAEVRQGGVMEQLGLKALDFGRSVISFSWDNYHEGNAGCRTLLGAGAVEFIAEA